MSEPGRQTKPLAYRMAPKTLDDFIGQRHILAEGKMLRRMIEADQMSSIILFGPPGTGKTSLARIIAGTTSRSFNSLNAVTSGVADIKRMIADCENPLFCPDGRMLLFIDEIHRFNKAQQDALLPSVEDGRIVLIGATTENPFFEVNKALVSRSTVFQLYPLAKEDLYQIIQSALRDSERGLGDIAVEMEEDAKYFIAERANGDARAVLNALELAVMSTRPDQNGTIRLNLEVMQDCMQKPALRYDKGGEEHYDTISAFIKSMRGSDPDAAIHYLARMLESGEDPEFIARRIVICAAEDVGLANPQLLSICQSAWQAVSQIGMPEARIILAEAVILVATSPKSNSAYLAIDRALEDVRSRNCGSIPYPLRNAPASGMKELGYGDGYLYAHSFPSHVAPMEFLPEELRHAKYYEAVELGYEKKLAEWMREVQKLKNIK